MRDFLRHVTAFPVGWGIALLVLCATPFAIKADTTPLESAFKQPPDSAKPHTWWHWMNGNISKEGITADLEAMKKVGLGGAQIFNVDCGIPNGPVPFMSPEWRAMVKHAIQEADRLGLELCLHNCAGWSSSGGPWITPELAMKKVTYDQVYVTGPVHVDQQLPKPATLLDYYRDIAVLAFPSLDGEGIPLREYHPKVTASNNTSTTDPAVLIEAASDGFITVPVPKPNEPQYIQIEFPEPFQAAELSIVRGPGGNPRAGDVQVSDDGVTFRSAGSFTNIELTDDIDVHINAPASRYFRIVFLQAEPYDAKLAIARIHLSKVMVLDNWFFKAAFCRADGFPRDARSNLPEGSCIDFTKIIDLTDHLDADGHLQWDAPEGRWTILRMGYTPRGQLNHPASKEGHGLECDKLSKEAAEYHWQKAVDPILTDMGPLAGDAVRPSRGLRQVLVDSYEVGNNNWTEQFRGEFIKRRGYDPILYLPSLTGRIVGSIDLTERFLHDFRKTIADLFADNYFGEFRTMCHRNGLEFGTEPYGNGGFDDITCGGKADVPMTEFWVGQGNDQAASKLASSIAHIYGRQYVGAEAFTADISRGRWIGDPFSMKALGDVMFTGGVNRFIFHRYAMQPWLDKFPGMTMGPWGTHFERTVTWWDQGSAWLTYLTRSQYLLQQGLFAADVCYFIGEESPSTLPSRMSLTPVLPYGYDYDGCDAQTVLTRMSVKDGKIVLPDGMAYSLLIMPANSAMTMPVLEKIVALVNEGATIVGPKPSRNPGLTGYPVADAAFKKLADELYGECDGTVVTENAYGDGRVIWGKPIDEILKSKGLFPDVETSCDVNDDKLNFIHRKTEDADIYFVCNWRPQTESFECSFRISGVVPELWHPDSGVVEKVPIYNEKDGRITLPIQLEPSGSVFVVFRADDKKQDAVVEAQYNGETIFKTRDLPGPALEIRKATYGVIKEDAPHALDVTDKFKRLVNNASLDVMANNSLGDDPAPNIVKQLRVDYSFNGKRATIEVNENQRLLLPEGVQPTEKDTLEIHKALYGLLPADTQDNAKPRTCDVTAQVAQKVHNGRLVITASNTLAGDPAPMTPKQLLLHYTVDGVEKQKLYSENETILLPDGEAWSTPVAELHQADENKVSLYAWEAGNYELTTASGKTLKADIQAVAPPLDLEGAWNVHFQAGRNAPESATFDRLASWTTYDDPGIKYFSGTAVYTKTLDLPLSFFASNTAYYLDLGRLKNLAEVTINGQELGVLWKPPYRVEVTSLLKPGANTIEIAITNLWPNRLIGDEQYPDDCEWNGDGTLKKWPDWFLNNQPRPSSQRCTFTTWKHYLKDAPLLESGLLGPVKIYPVTIKEIGW